MHRLTSSPWIVAPLLTFGAVLSGCPDGGGEVTLEDLPTRLAPTYCALVEGCGNPFTSALFSGLDCDDAILPVIEDSLLGQARAAVAAGTVVYHGELVDECLAALEGAGCGLRDFTAGVCTEIFEGTIAAGANCSWDEECIDGYCSTADGMCPGTCAARIPEGSPCPTGQGCAQGTSCSSGVCQGSAALGEACAGPEGVSCNSLDLTCVGASGTTPGTCRPWSEVLNGDVGDPCSVADDLCREGLSCVYAGVEGGMVRFECAAPSAPGAACAQGYPDPCPDDQRCEMGAMPGAGTCVPLPTAGEACVDACAPGSRCIDSICTVPARLGQPCAQNLGCHSSSCEDGVCASPGC